MTIPHHVQVLALEFGDELTMRRLHSRFAGLIYEQEQAVQAFYDYNAAYPDLVALNLEPSAA
jgi:hypothetical protein